MKGKQVRILIIGDSWASRIRNGGVSGNGKKSLFSKALRRYGFNDIETRGEKTVWAGVKASDFSCEENKRIIRYELESFTNIDTVHLIIGGNDYLHEVVGNKLLRKKDYEIINYFEDII